MDSHNHNHSHQHGHGQGHDHGNHHHHVLDPKLMVRIGIVLLVLTAITVVTALKVDIGALNFPLAMLIATTKAVLVCLFFMGLKYERRENAVIFSTSFLFLAIFLGFTVTDIFYRGDVYVTKDQLMAAAPKGKAKFRKPWVATSELIAHGKTLYGQNCTSCHGAEGKGDGIAAGNLNPKPRNFHATEGWKNGRKASEIFGTLANGLGGVMPAFGALPAEDRWAMAHYIRTLAPGAPEDSAADFAKVGVDPTKESAGEEEKVTIPVDVAMELMAKAPVDSKPAVRLNVQRFAQLPGAALYASQCASCHGGSGEGMEVRSLGVWPKVVLRTAAFTSELETVRSQAAFTEAMLKGIPGNSMPSYANLSGSELDALYEYVRALASARAGGAQASTQAGVE
jgi:caa(3)-type oxidase subunit IV